MHTKTTLLTALIAALGITASTAFAVVDAPRATASSPQKTALSGQVARDGANDPVILARRGAEGERNRGDDGQQVEDEVEDICNDNGTDILSCV